jgi:hypothetical protein
MTLFELTRVKLGLVVGVETRQKGTGKYLSDAVCDISNHSLQLTVLSEAPRLKETIRYLSSRFRATWQRVSQLGLIPLRSTRTTTSVNLVTEQRPLSVETLLPITPTPEQSHISSSSTADSLDLLSVTLNQTSSSSEPAFVETKGVEAKSAGPVDGRSSFLAILVSLIVAIAWF